MGGQSVAGGAEGGLVGEIDGQRRTGDDQLDKQYVRAVATLEREEVLTEYILLFYCY